MPTRELLLKLNPVSQTDSVVPGGRALSTWGWVMPKNKYPVLASLLGYQNFLKSPAWNQCEENTLLPTFRQKVRSLFSDQESEEPGEWSTFTPCPHFLAI